MMKKQTLIQTIVTFSIFFLSMATSHAMELDALQNSLNQLQHQLHVLQTALESFQGSANIDNNALLIAQIKKVLSEKNPQDLHQAVQALKEIIPALWTIKDLGPIKQAIGWGGSNDFAQQLLGLIEIAPNAKNLANELTSNTSTREIENALNDIDNVIQYLGSVMDVSDYRSAYDQLFNESMMRLMQTEKKTAEQQVKEQIAQNIQLNIKQIKTQAQPTALSGYHALYYAVNNVVPFKDNIKSPEQLFNALQTYIIKYRIEKGFETGLSDLLNRSGNYLIALEQLPSKQPFKGVSPTQIRSILLSTLSMVAKIESKEYTRTKYKLKTEELIASPYTVIGEALYKDVQDILKDDKRRRDLARHAGVSENALRIILTEDAKIKEYTRIDRDTRIDITKDQLLQWTQQNYQLEEAPNRQTAPMPEGKFLRSDELEYLLIEPALKNLLKNSQIKLENIISVIEDMGLLQIPIQQLTDEEQLNRAVLLTSLGEFAQKIRGSNQNNFAIIVNRNYQFRQRNIVPIWFTTMINKVSGRLEYLIADCQNMNLVNDDYVLNIVKSMR